MFNSSIKQYLLALVRWCWLEIFAFLLQKKVHIKYSAPEFSLKVVNTVGITTKVWYQMKILLEAILM